MQTQIPTGHKRSRVSSKTSPEVPVDPGAEMEVDSSPLDNITNDASHEPDTVPAPDTLDTNTETDMQPRTPDMQSEPNESEMPLPDDDETHKSDETSAEDDVDKEGSGKFVPPPTVEDAKLAYKDIQEILQPWRKTGAGHKDPGLDLLLQKMAW